MKHTAPVSHLNKTRHSYSLLGLPFDAVSIEDAAEIVCDAIDQQARCFLSTPNLNFTVMAQQDEAFYHSVINSDLVVADGMPLIWVAKLLKLPVYQRVAGSDLFAWLSNQPRERKIRVFFFGGETGIAKKAHAELNRLSPGMESCGFYDPGFVSIDEMSSPNVIDHINACQPDFIVVALGAKKGQQWIMHNWQELNAPVISHLGAVINFVAGSVQRAPEKWQRFGLEWLWRIKQEPKLYKRYLGDGFRFLQMLLTQTLPLAFYDKRLINKANAGNGCVLTDTLPQREKFIINMSGFIGDETMGEFEQAIHAALLSGQDVMIDGEKIEYLSSAVIARLQIFQGQLNKQQKALWLKDLPAEIVRLLRFSSVLHRFTLI